jgi:hypothetical protein
VRRQHLAVKVESGVGFQGPDLEFRLWTTIPVKGQY